jgi:hypothetical protein
VQLTIKKWTGEHQATGAMEYQPASVAYNQEHANIVSAHQQGNADIKFRMLTEFLRTQGHPGYTMSRLKEFARCFFYQDYGGKGAPAPGSSTWSKATWKARISFKFMEMYAAGWLDLEFGSDSWRDNDGNVDIAAYPSVKATVETMRETMRLVEEEEGTFEHMDEHWNLTLPVHWLTLGFIYQHGWRVVYEDGEERLPNDFQELYDESWGPEHRPPTAIKTTARERCNKSVIDQVTISGSPAESDVDGTLDALRKQNSVLDERCKTQQLILEQNAEQLQVQQRVIEKLTAEIAQLETGKDRVDQQPVNQTEPLDVCDERGVVDMEALTQGMGELMCKDEQLKEAMERLLPNAPPLDEDKIKKSGEVMRKKIKIKKKKKKDKEQA